jgi:hypothetical protein
MDTPETGGKPDKLDVSSLKPLPEKREVGSGVKKAALPRSEELKQQLSDPAREAFKRMRPGARRGAVIGHNWLDLFRDKEEA